MTENKQLPDDIDPPVQTEQTSTATGTSSDEAFGESGEAQEDDSKG